MASPLRSQIYSGGGAVFIGDGNADTLLITFDAFRSHYHRETFGVISPPFVLRLIESIPTPTKRSGGANEHAGGNRGRWSRF